ncbi:hypothetical protein K0M31_018785 [Melipona bicolor]|uniref:Uncharacterized protein n=1 Tax=Melipona bicolor TaxID=60889 RepID=A0AA40G4I1_9HYME|nr:hypothetical protein K0M31_018785 [Melipona bicolor]
MVGLLGRGSKMRMETVANVEVLLLCREKSNMDRGYLLAKLRGKQRTVNLDRNRCSIEREIHQQFSLHLWLRNSRQIKRINVIFFKCNLAIIGDIHIDKDFNRPPGNRTEH